LLPDPYLALKERLLELYKLDIWEGLTKLLNMQPLGDVKPSLFLERMLVLLPPGEEPTLLFKSLFLSKLPSDMRDHIQQHAELCSVRELAACADKIWQARNAAKPSSVAAIPSEAVFSDSEQLEEVTDAVAAIRLKGKQSKTQPPSSQQQHGRGKRHVERPNKASVLVCWIHAKYGAAAHRCADKQCGWKPSGN